MTWKNVEKYEKELTCRFKIDIRNLTNFKSSIWKSRKNLHFDGLLLSKVYNLWAKKVRRSYVWWHWIWIQNLKKNWLVLSKMTCNRLKNSDFILESKMVKISENRNSKQPDRPDAVWKLYFTLEINE